MPVRIDRMILMPRLRSAIIPILIIVFAQMFYAATVVNKPNILNLPQAQIVPQALGASLAVTTSNSYLGQGGYISAASSSVTITITDGNGFDLAQAWVIPANNTLWLNQYTGTYFPGGFTITCTGGCSSAHAYVSWYVAK